MKNLNFRVFYIFICFTFLTPSKVLTKSNNDSIPKYAIIRGSVDHSQTRDTVFITIWNKVVSYSKRQVNFDKVISSPILNNQFEIRIDSIQSGTYISIGRGRRLGQPNHFLEMLICEPGDNVNIKISDVSQKGKLITTKWGEKECEDCESYNFSGIGHQKYQCFWEIKKKESQLAKTKDYSTVKFNSLADKFEDRYSKHILWLNQRLDVLESYEKRISKKIYLQMKADLIGKSGEAFFNLLQYEFKNGSKTISKQEKSKFIQFYKDKIISFKKLLNIPNSITSYSATFPELLINIIKYENQIDGKSSDYESIKNNYTSLLKERLITNYILNLSGTKQIDSLLNDAIKILTLKPYLQALEEMKGNQTIGQPVYNFALKNEKEETVELSDFLGKIVFIDFWFTGCGGCSHYFKNVLSKVEHLFKDNKEVIFISISIDSEKQTWLKGLKSGLYTSDNVINLYTGTLGVGHPVIKQLNVTSYPHPILIDRSGRIYSNDDTILRKGGIESLIKEINLALSK